MIFEGVTFPIEEPHTQGFPTGWTVGGTEPTRTLVAPDGSVWAVEEHSPRVAELPATDGASEDDVLALDENLEPVWTPAAPGGSSPVKVAATTLHAAALLNLTNQQATIVPGVPGKIIAPISVLAHLDFQMGDTGYSVGTASLGISWDWIVNVIATNPIALGSCVGLGQAGATLLGVPPMAAAGFDTAIVGAPITLHNDGTELANGDSDVTFTTVYYEVAP